MQMCLFSRAAARGMILAGMFAALSSSVQAAALFTLNGTTDEVKRDSEQQVRLSILGWTADDQQSAVVSEFQKYNESQDHAGFEAFMRGLETKGYLFTHSPVGYTIKYAWQEENNPDKKVVLMVVPALKKNNPYMWKTENTSPAPFSLVELHMEGDEVVLKSSLDSKIVVNEAGKLQLEDYDSAKVFATLKDATPYYLKTN
jgi:hypothetical protein